MRRYSICVPFGVTLPTNDNMRAILTAHVSPPRGELMASEGFVELPADHAQHTQDGPGGGAPDYIQDQWYVAARLTELRRGQPLQLCICGQVIEFFRQETGHVEARTADEGKSLPCEVSEDLVWVFLASTDGADKPRLPVPVFGGPGGRIRFMEKVVIPAHQDDAVYGLLDPAHTPFVHRSPIWRGSGILKEKTKTFEPDEIGFTMMPHAPVNSDIYHLIGGAITVRIYFRLPGLRAEYIQNRNHTVLGLTALTPVDMARTVLRQIFYWDTPILTLIRPFATFIARPFLEQDVNIMKLRSQNIAFGGKGMLIGDSDRQFLWYLQLKKAWAEAGGNAKAFSNPLLPATLRWRT
jgi:phenylpropionate dioxygenase-like ring-hydroxylating dioxygenase large terminal subunit